jgi:hypothetical protein
MGYAQHNNPMSLLRTCDLSICRVTNCSRLEPGCQDVMLVISWANAYYMVGVRDYYYS